MRRRVKMKYILSLFVLLLTGCGTSGSSNDVALLGKWTLPCTNEDNGYSEQGTLLVSKSYLDFDTKRYFNSDCNEDELDIHFIFRDKYSTGRATKFSNGMDGTELNYVIIEETIETTPYLIFEEGSFVGTKIYSMYRMENKKLYFAYPDRDKGLDGLTSSKRADFFNGKYYIKDN